MVQNTKVRLSTYMSKIKLSLTIPNKLSDITLEQYQKYAKIIEGIDKEGEDAAEFVNLKALEIFCGLQLKDTYKLPMHLFDEVLQDIATCLNEPTPLIKRFWFRGNNGVEVEFGMEPDLHNIAWGPYMDIEKYLFDTSNMHKAMAALFRPIIKKKDDLYEIEPYEGSRKYADYMKYMPVNVALGAAVFFYRLGMKLSTLTLKSSLKEMTQQQQLQAEKKFLAENGVGISQFMQSLEAMSQSLTKLPTYHYTSV
jgi:hypothetical protein